MKISFWAPFAWKPNSAIYFKKNPTPSLFMFDATMTNILGKWFRRETLDKQIDKYTDRCGGRGEGGLQRYFTSWVQ